VSRIEAGDRLAELFGVDLHLGAGDLNQTKAMQILMTATDDQ
jgi:hypothetical protein